MGAHVYLPPGWSWGPPNIDMSDFKGNSHSIRLCKVYSKHRRMSNGIQMYHIFCLSSLPHASFVFRCKLGCTCGSLIPVLLLTSLIPNIYEMFTVLSQHHKLNSHTDQALLLHVIPMFRSIILEFFFSIFEAEVQCSELSPSVKILIFLLFLKLVKIKSPIYSY